MNKTLKRIIAIIALFLMAAIAYIIYDNNRAPVEPASNTKAGTEDLELPPAETSDWESYTNNRYAFRLMHPTGVTVDSSGLGAEPPETTSFFYLKSDLPKDSTERKNLPNLTFRIEQQSTGEETIKPDSPARLNVVNARSRGAEALARALWELNKNDPNPYSKDEKKVSDFEIKMLNGKKVYLFHVIGSYTSDVEDGMIELERTYMFTDHKGSILNFNFPRDSTPSKEVVSTITFID